MDRARRDCEAGETAIAVPGGIRPDISGAPSSAPKLLRWLGAPMIVVAMVVTRDASMILLVLRQNAVQQLVEIRQDLVGVARVGRLASAARARAVALLIRPHGLANAEAAGALSQVILYICFFWIRIGVYPAHAGYKVIRGEGSLGIVELSRVVFWRNLGGRSCWSPLSVCVGQRGKESYNLGDLAVAARANQAVLVPHPLVLTSVAIDRFATPARIVAAGPGVLSLHLSLATLIGSEG